jgi:hypothetical protein
MGTKRRTVGKGQNVCAGAPPGRKANVPQETGIFLDLGGGWKCAARGYRFRKLPVRYEKKARNYQGLAEFACAVIVWQNLIPVHPGLIPG